MKSHLFDTLYDKYPRMFQQQPIDCGITCGAGWLNLVDGLCSSIEQYHADSGAPPIAVQQIKEKFGELRFYYTGGDAQVRALVTAAKEVSITICEVCGVSGSAIQNDQGWWRTRCGDHVATRA